MTDNTTSTSTTLDDPEFKAALQHQAREMRRLFRELPSVATIQPDNSSERLTHLEETIAPIPIREPIVRHMAVAHNCLQRVGPAITKSYAEHSLFMLLRGAVENAALCVWLLADDDSELMKRILTNRITEILEEKRFNKLFGAQDGSYQAPVGLQKMNEAKVNEVLAVAGRLGIPESEIVNLGKRGNGNKTRKYTLTEIMKDLGEVNGIIDVFSMWSIASGLAHGGGQISSGIKHLGVQGVGGELVGYKTFLALGQAQTAHELYQIALTRYSALVRSKL